ncbi:MAG: CRISPR-associated endonuclease Cas1 [Opitutaceae bacterium]
MSAPSDPGSDLLPARMLNEFVYCPRLFYYEHVLGVFIHNAETRALYINNIGAWVSKKGETVVVKDREKILGEYRLKDIHHLALFGPVQLSTALVQTLCEKEIPISYFSMGGWFFGMTHGHGLTNVMTRIEQFKIAGDPDRALWLARLFIYGKIRNQRTLLMRNHLEPPPLLMRVLKHATSAALGANSIGTGCTCSFLSSSAT